MEKSRWDYFLVACKCDRSRKRWVRAAHVEFHADDGYEYNKFVVEEESLDFDQQALTLSFRNQDGRATTKLAPVCGA